MLICPLRLASGLLSLALAGGCSAMSQMGDAAVTLKEGQLCFSANPGQRSTEVVKLQALSVSGPRGAKRTGSKPPLMWAFWVAQGQPDLVFAAGSCLPYGVVPPSGEQTVQPQPLQPNNVYSIFLNARPSGGTVPMLGYKAEFCVSFDDAGKPAKVQVVPWDEKAKQWRYDVCESPDAKR